jgi:uncharacterized BrkB/YihY/UPF0761 family membrane protein
MKKKKVRSVPQKLKRRNNTAVLVLLGAVIAIVAVLLITVLINQSKFQIAEDIQIEELNTIEVSK